VRDLTTDHSLTRFERSFILASGRLVFDVVGSLAMLGMTFYFFE
jgi:hypothetical protein